MSRWNLGPGLALSLFLFISFAYGQNAGEYRLSRVSTDTQADVLAAVIEEKLLEAPLRNALFPEMYFSERYMAELDAAQKKEAYALLSPGPESALRRGAFGLLASLNPLRAVEPQSFVRLISDEKLLTRSGRLPHNPVDLYNDFEIRVNIRGYALELLASKYGREPVKLFSCNTGLGSSEFPTPRGSYFVVRIFDDRPMWIPPKSDWAVGLSANRSTYGGHMLPFYTKKKPRKDDDDQPLLNLECVAPEMNMEDNGFYRIHGTDQPWTIGEGSSHGCVRLRNKDVAQLADTLKGYVGITERGENENGTYVNLRRPVKLTLF